LKKVFRKKQVRLPYQHGELVKTPFEVLDEETKVGFNESKLAPMQLKAF